MNLESIRNALKCPENFPRIIGQENMFRSAVLVPLLQTGEGWSVLFQKRAAGIRQPGEICFPGGGYDEQKDRDFKATALRETLEETGLEEDKIEVLGSPGTLLTPMGVLVQPWLGVLSITDIKDLKPNPEEVEELFTIPVSWFRENPPRNYELPVSIHPYTRNRKTGEMEYHFPSHELDLPEKYKNPWEGKIRYRVIAYKTERGTLWGITAQILGEILPLLDHL